MDGSVARRVFGGVRANAFNQFVSILVQLVGVPVLLLSWGAQQYGEWLVLFAIPAYLGMTDLGFSQSAGNDMTAKVGRGDKDGAVVVFQSLIALVYPVSVLAIAIAGVLSLVVPLAQWLSFVALDDGAARWVLWLFVVEVCFQLVNASTHAAYKASGEYALHVQLNASTRLLQHASVWAIALVGASPLLAAAAFCSLRVLATLGCLLLVRQRQAWLSIGFAKARLTELRRLLAPALANIAVPIAQALNIQGMVLVVATVLGPPAVVVFSTIRTLTRIALQVVRAISGAVEPEMARAWGASDLPLVRKLFLHAVRASLWLSGALVAGLAVFGELILSLWTRGEVAMHAVLFACLLASAVASTLWYSPLFLLRAANRHMASAVAAVLGAAAALVMAYLGLTSTGHIAVAGQALLVADLAVAVFTLMAGCRLLGLRLADLSVVLSPVPLIDYFRRRVRHAAAS
ncbi:MAG: hypothetical protein AAFX85_04220 [Pseudomonadota bacterium]